MARNFDRDEIQERPFDPHQFRRLLRFLRPYTALVIGTLFLMLFLSLAMLAGPILLRAAIDGPIKERNLSSLHLIGLTYLLLRVGVVIASYYRTRLMNRTGQGIIYDMREQLFDHIQSLSLRFFDGRPAGKIMVRITNDVESLNALLTSGIVQVINDIFTLAFIIIIMVGMHWQLALYTFAIIPILLFLAFKLRPLVRVAWRLVRSKRANMNANLQERISGMRSIQAFVQEDKEMQEFADINQEFASSWMRAMRINMIFGPSVEITGAIGLCIVYFAGAHMVINEAITAGTLVAFISYVGRFWEPIGRMSNFYNQVLVAMASSERVFEILDTVPEIADSPGAVELPDIEGRVELSNVIFSYDPGVVVLNDVSLVANKGETIALVGPTGAGKSSIINLIPRFYDTDSGAVLIDGYDVKDVTVNSLRDQIGLVLQDTFVFSGTIRENIRYGKLDATEEEIIAAAKAVNAHDFIVGFDRGYDTEVNERGSTLSVGQRQLISFARALLADPRILILDEATSSIDTQTEQLVQEALATLLKGRTSFIIAHRLSTIRNADKIFVIDDGKIVESGNHEKLMKQKGVYYNLNKVQFKYLQEVAT